MLNSFLRLGIKKLIDELLVDCSDSQKDVLKQQFIDEGITIPQNLIIVGTVNMDESTLFLLPKKFSTEP